ncbi:hypothetical protein ACIRVK_13705 [Streptomyces sp. NPDC101152]|uniref:hypothetical protein n=1 Tax=Streptomyces sp. NPDC101152 TaxID=3366116 RepID=UPI003830549A
MLPEPGTVMTLPGGVAVVYVGDVPGAVEVEALAPRLLEACEVVVVGAMWSVAKPFKDALFGAWSEAGRRARAVSRPPVPEPVRERCGRPRRDGRPCRRWAGAGTDTPGVGPCANHGGSTAVRDAEKRRLAGQAETFATLARKATTMPLTPRERLEGLEALRDVVAARTRRRPSTSPPSP